MNAGRRPTGPARDALRAYRGLPLAARLHAELRWWSAPFTGVEKELPATGRILEIGCGHGLFCTYVALAGPARRVVGVDIDAGKIAAAQQVAERLRGARPGAVEPSYEVARSGAVASGPWDAIAIIDMLYLLPAAEQRALLTLAASQLAPGGLLVIKEMSATPRWKASWNQFQETLSVSVLGITERAERSRAGDGALGPRFDFVAPQVMAGWLGELGLATSSRRLDQHRLHPHHLLIGRAAS